MTGGTVAEAPEHRLKRLRMRSWRRGMREMDLLLGPFADAALGGLDAAALDTYERFLAENDQELYLWVAGRVAAPDAYAELVATIARHHGFGGFVAVSRAGLNDL